MIFRPLVCRRLPRRDATPGSVGACTATAADWPNAPCATRTTGSALLATCQLSLAGRQQPLDSPHELTAEVTAASTPGSGAIRSSTPPTRSSPSAPTTRSQSGTSRALPAWHAASCTTTSADARRSTSPCSERLGNPTRGTLRPPAGRSARARVADSVSRSLDWTEANRTVWLATIAHGEDIADIEVRRAVADLVRRAVALLAAYHADIAEDTPRLRHALALLDRAQSRRHATLAGGRGHPRGDPRLARLHARPRAAHLRRSACAQRALIFLRRASSGCTPVAAA